MVAERLTLHSGAASKHFAHRFLRTFYAAVEQGFEGASLPDLVRAEVEHYGLLEQNGTALSKARTSLAPFTWGSWLKQPRRRPS